MPHARRCGHASAKLVRGMWNACICTSLRILSAERVPEGQTEASLALLFLRQCNRAAKHLKGKQTNNSNTTRSAARQRSWEALR